MVAYDRKQPDADKDGRSHQPSDVVSQDFFLMPRVLRHLWPPSMSHQHMAGTPLALWADSSGY